MMIELSVRYSDGRGEVVTAKQNDAAGRRYVDRVAWRLLSSPKVSSCSARIVERSAGYLRPGRSIGGLS